MAGEGQAIRRGSGVASMVRLPTILKLSNGLLPPRRLRSLLAVTCCCYLLVASGMSEDGGGQEEVLLSHSSVVNLDGSDGVPSSLESSLPLATRGEGQTQPKEMSGVQREADTMFQSALRAETEDDEETRHPDVARARVSYTAQPVLHLCTYRLYAGKDNNDTCPERRQGSGHKIVKTDDGCNGCSERSKG